MGIQMESNIFRAIQNDLCYKTVVHIIDLLDIIFYNYAEELKTHKNILKIHSLLLIFDLSCMDVFIIQINDRI